MNGCFLKFYMMENRRHHHRLAYEWLLEEAKRLGLPGGAAFRSIAGYGRHRQLHEGRFFELAAYVPVEVGFAVTQEEADRFVEHVTKEGLSLFYIRLPVEFGYTEGNSR
jgi:PII-like signaling protein